MTTEYIITFYAVIAALVAISFAAGYHYARHKHHNVSPNKNR